MGNEKGSNEQLFRIGAETVDPNAEFDPRNPIWSIGQARRLDSFYFRRGDVVIDKPDLVE